MMARPERIAELFPAVVADLAAAHRTPNGEPMTAAEKLAALFHATYERMAPRHGYSTRTATAVPWSEVKDPNRTLMIDVASTILAKGYVRTWAYEFEDDRQFAPPVDCGLLVDGDGEFWTRDDEGAWYAASDPDTKYVWAAALGEGRVLREAVLSEVRAAQVSA